MTDEFAPGFRNSAASYTVSRLQPKVIRDMELERHGLQVVLRKIDNFLPGPKGSYLLSGRDGLTRAELARLDGVEATEDPALFGDAVTGVLIAVVGVAVAVVLAGLWMPRGQRETA